MAVILFFYFAFNALWLKHAVNTDFKSVCKQSQKYLRWEFIKEKKDDLKAFFLLCRQRGRDRSFYFLVESVFSYFFPKTFLL